MTLAAGFLLTLLAPLAIAGLALVNTGLTRSRNAAHSMVAALAACAVAALVYFAWGFAIAGQAGGPACTVMIGAKSWRWLGAERLFLRGVAFDGSQAALLALFGMFAAGLAATIPLGAGSDRWRLGAIGWSTVLLAGGTFPLVAHWVWGGGWLAQLGENYSLGRGIVDAGGAAPIHAVGGLTALAMAWILGPRHGKYNREGMPAAIPGHNAVMVLLGCFLAWLGWMGLNCAGAVLFAGADLGRVPLAALNTTLAAAAGVVTVATITRFRFGRADASLCANGWVAGLVSASAGCVAMRPAGAVLAGAVGGALAIYSIELLELHVSVDDPGGAISVHGVGGVWSLLAAGLLAWDSAPGQFTAQVVGVATLLGAVLPLALAGNWVLDRVRSQRVAREAERQGLDLAELGAGAYPDFVSHDDSYLR